MLRKKTLIKDGESIDIGHVGDVVKVNEKLILDILKENYLPVVSPVGSDGNGNAYNINADYVAATVSTTLKAEKLILLTDIKGIYEDIDNPESFIAETNINELHELIKKDGIKEGMIPKIQCCIEAINGGVKNVHLIDGRQEHSILLEVFTQKGIGTLIKGGEDDE
jgi:acetylglutamate kinase